MSSNYNILNQRSRITKQLASEFGFEHCGIAQARRLNEHEQSLNDYLNSKYHGKMHYMENYFEKRLDPRKLVPGTKTVISLMYNYFPEEYFDGSSPYKISRYALGKDYHFIMKDKLKTMVSRLQEQLGDFSYRVFVDTAPVLERAWAKESGLGWIGKNTMLINLKHGSYFFLAEIMLSMEMAYDKPMLQDFCGSCHRCIDACPTNALSAYKIDASKCISYLTIENREGQIPEAFSGHYQQWIFGCDICQEVCPWNKFSITHNESEFLPHDKLFDLESQQWEELSKEDYQELFRKSAVKRAKFSGIKRNIDFLQDQNL